MLHHNREIISTIVI